MNLQAFSKPITLHHHSATISGLNRGFCKDPTFYLINLAEHSRYKFNFRVKIRIRIRPKPRSRTKITIRTRPSIRTRIRMRTRISIIFWIRSTYVSFILLLHNA